LALLTAWFATDTTFMMTLLLSNLVSTWTESLWVWLSITGYDHIVAGKLCMERKLCRISSSRTRSVRRVACSLILNMKLVPPSLSRSCYVPSSFWSVLVWYPVCVHPLYVL
jgi:hypothetical protein